MDTPDLSCQQRQAAGDCPYVAESKNGSRILAWQDTLDHEGLDELARQQSMSPEYRSLRHGVELYQLRRHIDTRFDELAATIKGSKRSWPTNAARSLGAMLAGAVLLLLGKAGLT